MKNNRIMLGALIISVLFSVTYIFTNRISEKFIFGGEIMNFIYAVSISVIAAGIFYLFQVYIPEKRKKDIIKSNFEKIYIDFKESCLSIFLSAQGRPYSPDLLENLLNLEEFKSYFKKKEGCPENQDRWHVVMNALHNKGLLRQLLFCCGIKFTF